MLDAIDEVLARSYFFAGDRARTNPLACAFDAALPVFTIAFPFAGIGADERTIDTGARGRGPGRLVDHARIISANDGIAGRVLVWVENEAIGLDPRRKARKKR